MGVAIAAGVAIVPSGTQDATARSTARTPPEERTALRAGLQLAAMRTAVAAAPDYFIGLDSNCPRTTPMITFATGNVLAGNFRDASGACYVWINLAHSPLLTAQEICKTTLHEMGHLMGLRHSEDPADVMYSPFAAKPIPGPCIQALGKT